MSITTEQGRALLQLARRTISLELGLAGGDEPLLTDPIFARPAATFVTLKIKDQLRGCIGSLTPQGSLAENVKANAINAAFRDTRFRPLREEELAAVHIDISILSEPKPLAYNGGSEVLQKLRPGVDGVILSLGGASATFLPQVWQQLPEPEQFLGQLCRKAGLSPSSWRDQHPQIEIYEVDCFAEGEVMTAELVLDQALLLRLQGIYAEMEDDYARVARAIGLQCTDCSDNCCDSYFLHHTYAEWAYLWLGLRLLPAATLDRLRERARRYLEKSAEALDQGERPRLMCPLNEEGLCLVYAHRLMVCRTHGVPARMCRPDGRVITFPGCFRCQQIALEKKDENLPVVDRTAMLRQLVMVEKELLEPRRGLFPKIKMTIAEMVVQGPPQIPEAGAEG